MLALVVYKLRFIMLLSFAPTKIHYSLVLVILLLSFAGTAQTKNFIDQPYLETTARVDTLVTPDRIYLSVLITEEDTKGRISVEELENRMAAKLKSLGIDLEKQLSLSDLGSDFRKYFLRKTDILKEKAYTLLLYDGLTVGKVLQGLESIGIANVNLRKTEYSDLENLKLTLRERAVALAKSQAIAMTRPLSQNVGNALYISDLNTGFVRSSGVYNEMERMQKSNTAEPLDVGFRKIRVESSVNVKFAIE